MCNDVDTSQTEEGNEAMEMEPIGFIRERVNSRVAFDTMKELFVGLAVG